MKRMVNIRKKMGVYQPSIFEIQIKYTIFTLPKLIFKGK